MIIEMIQEWFKELLIDGIISNLSGTFDTVNTKVAEIAGEVGMTPSGWNGGIFNMIRSLSDTVIVPIAGIILTFTSFSCLIQQRTPGVENMPTARLAEARGLQFRHDLFNMLYAMSPEAFALPVGQSRPAPQFRHRQPGVSHQGVDIRILFHERSTA